MQVLSLYALLLSVGEDEVGSVRVFFFFCRVNEGEYS